MRVSWIVLTFNRGEKVAKAMDHNIVNAGEPHDELIWVDNGSSVSDSVRDVMPQFLPDVSILHEKNLGVAKGYNRGMVMATGDYIVITGCDMLMPKDWLKTFKAYLTAIPTTGIACMYHKPLSDVPERIRGDEEIINGKNIVRAMPIERRIFSRDLLGKIGFLREDFGLYGWEDVEWGYRAERICNSLGKICYVIPGMAPIHLGTEGVERHKTGGDSADYHAFKQKEAMDPKKMEVFQRCRSLNFPYYNPFPRA